MGDFEVAQKVEELLGAEGGPDGSDPAVQDAWERQLRVHLLLYARYGDSDVDATFASIRAAGSGSRRERIADGIGRRTGRRMRPSGWRRYAAPLATAAVLLVAIMVGKFLLVVGASQAGAPTLAVTPSAVGERMILERSPPGVVVERGQHRVMPDAGMVLSDGDVVATAAEGARVAFTDGTAVDIAAGTRVTLSQLNGKALTLQAGGLDAAVVKQPAGQPLRIRSPGSRVEVVGTRFTLRMEPVGTRLTVDEGTVRMADQEGGRAVPVTVGQQAVGSWFHPPALVAPFDPARLTRRLPVPCDDAAAWKEIMYGPITAEVRRDAGRDAGTGPAHLRLGLTAAGRDGWGSRGIPLRLMDGDQAFALRLRVVAAKPGTVVAFDMADDVDNTWRLGELPVAAGAGWQQWYIPFPPASDPPPRTMNGRDGDFTVRRLRLLWVYVRGVADIDLADLTVLAAPGP